MYDHAGPSTRERLLPVRWVGSVQEWCKSGVRVIPNALVGVHAFFIWSCDSLGHPHPINLLPIKYRVVCTIQERSDRTCSVAS